jgi:hypothetical protein
MRDYKEFFVAALVLSGGCASAVSNDVVVIEKTHSYHRGDCIRTNMAKIAEMPLDSAKAKGMLPCPLCMKPQ